AGSEDRIRGQDQRPGSEARIRGRDQRPGSVPGISGAAPLQSAFPVPAAAGTAGDASSSVRVPGKLVNVARKGERAAATAGEWPNATKTITRAKGRRVDGERRMRPIADATASTAGDGQGIADVGRFLLRLVRCWVKLS